MAKEKRAAKTIAVIIFVFSFCWLPFFVAYVIRPFCETCKLHAKVSFYFVNVQLLNYGFGVTKVVTLKVLAQLTLRN